MKTVLNVYTIPARLNLDATVLCADARYPEQWWKGDKFDRILPDAPCSATGVIRRHPDIKWLRRGEDIAALATLQAEIFDAMWLQLKTGGTLVYATCSITPQENCDQVKAFLARTSDATLIGSEPVKPGSSPPALRRSNGWFLLRSTDKSRVSNLF